MTPKQRYEGIVVILANCEQTSMASPATEVLSWRIILLIHPYNPDFGNYTPAQFLCLLQGYFVSEAGHGVFCHGGYGGINSIFIK